MKILATPLSGLILAIVSAATFIFVPESRAIVWDDFQSYTQYQVLANGFQPQAGSNSRWGRFGLGTADNPVAMGGFGPNGETVGDYPLLWSLGNNGNLAYHFPTTTNLTATPGFSIQLMSTYYALTNTAILAVFEDLAGNIWQTTLTNAQYFQTEYVWQTNKFVFSPEVMEQVQGNSPFDLSSVINLRIRFVNRSGDSISQHIYFFDLESSSLPPAPVLGALTFGTGNSVTIQFTSADDVAAENFVLQTSPVLGASATWTTDDAATIQSLGSGKYQVTATRSGNPAQFFRVKRL